ncbi:speriolin-like [Colius striatus]|uniref:speriolin-like n=1 Tax=Colius striatus TaxID=57412 RepID=UPI002B1E5AB0|nr:speriolin-like [Colius striatus]
MEPGPSGHLPGVRPVLFTVFDQLRDMTNLLFNRNQELRRELERQDQQPFQHGYRGAGPSSAPPYVSVPHRVPRSFPSSGESAGSSVAASGLWVPQLPTSTPRPVARPSNWGLTLTEQSWTSGTPSWEPSFSRRESWQPRWQRLLGEIAFQLDRRIVHRVFPNADRYRGFSAATIPEGIMEMVEETERGASRDLSVAAIWNYEFVMRRLWALGYVPEVHLPAIEAFINTYGRLERSYWFPAEPNVAFLRHVVSQEVPPDLRPNAMVLLECLLQLAQEDGQPLFCY